jgi:hypothetical protein
MRILLASLLLFACGERPRTQEDILRDQFARKLAEREGVLRAYRLQSSYDVRFGSSFSGIGFDPKGDYRGKAFRWIGQHSFVRLRPHGTKPMNLAVYGWIDTAAIHTRPAVTAYIDGKVIADMVVGADGGFALIGTAPPDILAGKQWVTLEISVSSVSFHWSDPPDLMVANILDFDWSEGQGS